MTLRRLFASLAVLALRTAFVLTSGLRGPFAPAFALLRGMLTELGAPVNVSTGSGAFATSGTALRMLCASASALMLAGLRLSKRDGRQQRNS